MPSFTPTTTWSSKQTLQLQGFWKILHDMMNPFLQFLTDAQTLASVFNSTKCYVSAMDLDKALPNKGEILSSLKRFLDLLHAHMPVKEGYGLGNKRKRQCLK